MTMISLSRPIGVVAALLLTAACDSGGVVDQTVRAGVRQSAVEACQAWVPQSELVTAAGVDAGRLCGCAADRVLADKSAAELADIGQSSADIRAAAVQCIAELGERGTRDGPGGSSTANTAF
jgi:hypothetical protein